MTLRATLFSLSGPTLDSAELPFTQRSQRKRKTVQLV